jgi:hypothetical protein
MRPRGIPASMKRATATYAYTKKQPARRAELDEALSVDSGDDWYCVCHVAAGPHIHCPWGGGHIHLVDPETGKSITEEAG